MGANLARLEARVTFEELLARVPEYELEEEPRWYPSPWARALQSVRVRFPRRDGVGIGTGPLEGSRLNRGTHGRQPARRVQP